MKTWIDWMSRIADGMLFQGGYVTSPTMVAVGRPAPVAGDATRAPEGCEDSRARPIAACTCHEKGPGDCPGAYVTEEPSPALRATSPAGGW